MLRSRRLARSLARKRTLPHRMLRELRWLWRDVKDLHTELTCWSDRIATGNAQRQREAEQDERLRVEMEELNEAARQLDLALDRRQSEMNDQRDRTDGDW